MIISAHVVYSSNSCRIPILTWRVSCHALLIPVEQACSGHREQSIEGKLEKTEEKIDVHNRVRRCIGCISRLGENA